jgi:hypothetical protein
VRQNQQEADQNEIPSGREKFVMLKTLAVGAALMLSAVPVRFATAASADPAPFDNGFGNAQDTVNALTARGYNVVLNGAAVNPLSSCKVVGVEGLNASNVDSSGNRIDPAQFDTVYVDILCRGG